MKFELAALLLLATKLSARSTDESYDLTHWISALPSPTSHTVFQVGANDGSAHINDPIQFALRKGWHAVLLEPMAEPFAKLQQRHLHASTAGRVRVVNAALCPPTLKQASAVGEPGAASSVCAPRREMYFVDFSNATGNWGSAKADARCLGANSRRGISESCARVDSVSLVRTLRASEASARAESRHTAAP